MTTVKSRLATSVRAAKSQIDTKSAPDETPEPKTKPKAASRKPKQTAPKTEPKAMPKTAHEPAHKSEPRPKARHRLAAVLEPAGAPAASAGELFPARVWPD
ncbi:hypothetical protein [Acidiphilium acidophilum]|uniref:Uncharacterized protein n=1 Tax=Acidiphilium acidophilum TaxID=76588 RepID=A0AAW9DPJ8_ACIAO|nr:hypothetical protein [Acidiphilium acidophilum]MDX5930140.1 hypothetical protein [Acidiphilium acidophilum]